MNVRLSVFGFVFLLLTGACASNGPAIPRLDDRFEGSFTIASGRGEEAFVVPVTVNGVGPLPFLLDTGATSSAVYPRAMRAAGLLPSPDASVTVRGLTRAEAAPLVEVESLRIGDATRKDLTLPALPAPAFGEIAGILGLDILRDFALVWDAERRAMTFVPKDVFDAAPFSGWDRVPLTERPFDGPVYGIVFATADLGGRDVPVLIDTGTAPSVVNWEAASFSRAVRRLRSRLRSRWEVEGASGRFSPRAIATLPTLFMGEHEWRLPQLLILDLAPLDVLGAEGEPLMIAGADMLSVRSFALDFDGGLLLMSPPVLRGPSALPVEPRGIGAEVLTGS